jgi:hypothetical protein
MPRITIPSIGTLLTLTKSWTFGLYPEQRNSGVWKVLVGEGSLNYRDLEARELRAQVQDFVPVTLPKGTVLSVDRIYIRQKYDDYDSVSFRIKECPDERLDRKRFWAKLHDVNEMYGQWDENTVPRETSVELAEDHYTVPISKWHLVRERLPSGLRMRLWEDKSGFIIRVINDLVCVWEIIDGIEQPVFMEDDDMEIERRLGRDA